MFILCDSVDVSLQYIKCYFSGISGKKTSSFLVVKQLESFHVCMLRGGEVTVTLCGGCGGWQMNMPSSSWLRPSTLQRSRGTSVDRGARGMGIG